MNEHGHIRVESPTQVTNTVERLSWMAESTAVIESITIFVWLTGSVNHSVSSPKIFIPAFVTVNSVVVTWFTIVEDRLQCNLG